jgi:predicted dehydrogenase
MGSDNSSMPLTMSGDFVNIIHIIYPMQQTLPTIANLADLPRKVGLGLYGINGHQIDRNLGYSDTCDLVAVAGFPDERLPDGLRDGRRCGALTDLLKIPEVELVVLCSPSRAGQAADAIACLEAGRHVLAEKPCATNEDELDRILATAARTGRIFHEMAGSAFEQPFVSLFDLVRRDGIGRVRQIYAQKSYPLYDGRPSSPEVDGGLFLQAGIHAARWIDHGLDLEIFGGSATEVCGASGAPVAASAVLDLGNAATATLIVNYLNPMGFGSWGNETLRVWGDRGMAEIVDGGARTRWVEGDQDRGEIPTIPSPSLDWLESLVAEIRGLAAMPLTLDREIRPLRGLLRCAGR